MFLFLEWYKSFHNEEFDRLAPHYVYGIYASNMLFKQVQPVYWRLSLYVISFPAR